MNTDNILSVLCGQNSASAPAFDPEYHQFRNKVITLQNTCPMVECEYDPPAKIPFCKLDNALCSGQCVYRSNNCRAIGKGDEMR